MTWCQNIYDQIKQKSSKLCGKTWFAIDMRANRGAQLNGVRAIKAANERAIYMKSPANTIKYGAFAVCYAIVWCIVFAGLSRKPHTRFQELWSLPRRLALPMKQATSIRSNSSVNCKLLNDKDIHPKQLNRMIYCAYFEPEVFL